MNKKHEEQKILNNIYKMGIESLDPESFEQLENILDTLSKTRNIDWRSMDVGVDCWEYEPLLVDNFIDKLQTQKFGRELGEFKGLRE